MSRVTLKIWTRRRAAAVEAMGSGGDVRWWGRPSGRLERVCEPSPPPPLRTTGAGRVWMEASAWRRLPRAARARALLLTRRHRIATRWRCTRTCAARVSRLVVSSIAGAAATMTFLMIIFATATTLCVCRLSHSFARQRGAPIRRSPAPSPSRGAGTWGAALS